MGELNVLDPRRHRLPHTLVKEAFRTMLEVKPMFRTQIAVELYRNGKTSLGRSAEIVGVSRRRI